MSGAHAPEGKERSAAERIGLGIAIEWKKDRSGVVLDYKNLDGFKIYVEKKNGFDFKGLILDF